MISKHAEENFPSSLTTAQRKELGPLPTALHCASETKKVAPSKFHLKVPPVQREPHSMGMERGESRGIGLP